MHQNGQRRSMIYHICPKHSVARELEDLADAVHPQTHRVSANPTAETKEETRAAKGGHARSKRKKKRGSNYTLVVSTYATGRAKAEAAREERRSKERNQNHRRATPGTRANATAGT